MNRSKSREVAMKLLYESTINKVDFNILFENYNCHFSYDVKDIQREYIEKVFNGVNGNLELLDKKIEGNLTNWKISRVSKINLTILRVAIYEIIFEESVPTKVAINEAIELAKVYSEDKSPNFINGVLANFI